MSAFGPWRGPFNGALDGGALCHVSNLGNYNVACHLATHVSCRP